MATRLDGPGARSHYGAQPLLPQPACSQLGKASERDAGSAAMLKLFNSDSAFGISERERPIPRQKARAKMSRSHRGSGSCQASNPAEAAS